MEVSQDFAKVMDKDELIDQDAVKEVIDSVGERQILRRRNKLSTF